MARDNDETDDPNQNKALSVSERRQAIFDRTVSKFAAAGFRIDTDPEFIAHINRWIAGEVEMHEASARYEDLLKQKRRGSD